MIFSRVSQWPNPSFGRLGFYIGAKASQGPVFIPGHPANGPAADGEIAIIAFKAGSGCRALQMAAAGVCFAGGVISDDASYKNGARISYITLL